VRRWILLDYDSADRPEGGGVIYRFFQAGAFL